MCREYKLLFAAGSVSRYPASMANFILFTDEKRLLYQH